MWHFELSNFGILFLEKKRQTKSIVISAHFLFILLIAASFLVESATALNFWGSHSANRKLTKSSTISLLPKEEDPRKKDAQEPSDPH